MEKQEMYDYLIVGAGLYGAVFARMMADTGKSCLVVERRPHIGGNVYTEKIEGIQIHKYGPHIFHTEMKEVWEFVNRFASFNHFRYEPIANYCGTLYNLPFNMNTFHAVWGVNTPAEAEGRLKAQQSEVKGEPNNLEEQAIKLVGRDIYEKLVKGYTEKQWGRKCRDLPPFLIKRLPVRMNFDNNYFEHPYQGIPIGGYTSMVARILSGIHVELNCDFMCNQAELKRAAPNILFTGPLDEYYKFCYGPLEYRSLRFETERLPCNNFQGVAGMNFTDNGTPYTRIVEHKWFEFGRSGGGKTVITREYPVEWKPGMEPYYPINDSKNQSIYSRYKELAKEEQQTIFGGRLAEYRYYDMDKVIKSAIDMANAMK